MIGHWQYSKDRGVQKQSCLIPVLNSTKNIIDITGDILAINWLESLGCDVASLVSSSRCFAES